jgi:hypothetical protein
MTEQSTTEYVSSDVLTDDDLDQVTGGSGGPGGPGDDNGIATPILFKKSPGLF